MQPLNRVCFEIEKDPLNPEGSFDKAIDGILDWLKTRQFIEDAALVLDLCESAPEKAAGPTAFVESISIKEDGKRGWGVRFRHQDNDNSKLLWMGDVTLWDTGGKSIFYSNIIGVRHGGDGLSPVIVAHSNPLLNREMLKLFKGRTGHGHRLIALPLKVSKDHEAALLYQILNHPSRSHPVVYVTPDHDGRYLADASSLATGLAGMAHVVVADNPQIAESVNTTLPPSLGCDNGGVRIYWPHLHDNSDAGQHPLFLNWQILELGNRVTARFVEMIARQTVLFQPEGYMTWQDLKNLDYRRNLQAAEQNGCASEMLELFERENRRQHQALQEANEEIARLRDLLMGVRQLAVQMDLSLRSVEVEEPCAAGLEQSDVMDTQSVRHPESQNDGEDSNDREAISEEEEISDPQASELPAYSYASHFSTVERTERLKIPIGVSTNVPQGSPGKKPDKFRLKTGDTVATGDWIVDNDYGIGYIDEVNSIPYYGDATDGHRIWFYNNGKPFVMQPFQLRKLGVRQIAAGQISEEAKAALENR